METVDRSDIAEGKVLSYLVKHPSEIGLVEREDFINGEARKVFLAITKISNSPSKQELDDLTGIDTQQWYNEEVNNYSFWVQELKKRRIIRMAQNVRQDIIDAFICYDDNGEHYNNWYKNATLEEVQKKLKELNNLVGESDEQYIVQSRTKKQGFLLPKDIPGADKPMEWLIDGVFMKDTFNELIGPQKSAKTQLALQLAASVQNGLEFLGHKTVKSEVLYVDYEQTPSELKNRTDNLKDFYTRNFNLNQYEQFRILSLNKDTDTELDDILHMIRDEKKKNSNVNLVILDNFYSILSSNTDSNSMTDMKDLLTRIKKGVGENITVVLVNHTTKATAKSKANKIDYYDVLTSAFGSNVHGMFASEILYIEPKIDGKTIWVAGRHISPELEIPCFFGQNTNFFFKNDGAAVDLKLSEEQCKEIDEYLFSSGSNNTPSTGSKAWSSFRRKFPNYTEKVLEISGYSFNTHNKNKYVFARAVTP